MTDEEPRACWERSTRHDGTARPRDPLTRRSSMAESKRQSIAGKVATPKVGPAKDVIDADSNLYKAVGAR